MKYLVILACVFISLQTSAQELLRFSIQLSEKRINAPVSVSLDGIDYNSDGGNFVLYEIKNGKEVETPCQIEAGYSAKLWFLLHGITDPNTTKEFLLKLEEKPSQTISHVTLKSDHKDVSLLIEEKPILNYRFSTTFPPDGVDPVFKRSGFIHPVWSPGGEILSRIQPPDHYHHYGIWGPWTKTSIDGRHVDFWNLASGEGTVNFAGFLSQTEGNVYSGFQVLQQHIDFGAKGEDQVAMNEILDVRSWNLGDEIYMFDYTTSLNSPLENGILLEAYRYGGGIGFRATEKWHKDNCTVLTSDQKTRPDADGSYAKWCIVEGESDTEKGRSGLLFLSHPSNRMHPEPMRVWPLDANGGRGDMYFEFVPIRHDDWKIEPQKEYTLKYRVIVFDGKMDAETAEMYWQSFAKMPSLKILN